MRQDHDAADDRRIREARLRPHRTRRPRRRGRPPAQAARQHRVPDLRAVPVHVRVGQRRIRAALSEDVPRRNQAASGRGTGSGPDDRLRQTPSDATVRRPAAARRAGPGTGAAPERAAARRAARCTGCQAAQAVTARTAGGATRGRDHVRLRDARPGRGPDDERSDRRHGRRPGRAGRPARGDLLRTRDHLRRRIPGCGQHL